MKTCASSLNFDGKGNCHFCTMVMMVVIAIIHHMIILIIIYVLFRFTKSPRTTYIMNMLTSSDTLKTNNDNNDWPRQQTKLKLTTYLQTKPHHQIKSTSYHQAQGLECFHTKTEKRWRAEQNKKTKKRGVQACHVILKNLADLYLACYCYIQIHILVFTFVFVFIFVFMFIFIFVFRLKLSCFIDRPLLNVPPGRA